MTPVSVTSGGRSWANAAGAKRARRAAVRAAGQAPLPLAGRGRGGGCLLRIGRLRSAEPRFTADLHRRRPHAQRSPREGERALWSDPRDPRLTVEAPQGASLENTIVPEAANMPPTPWAMLILAFGTWAGAIPRICRTLSCSAYMPYM